jgi:uncharacterized protein (TIGR03084 family)
MMRGSIGDRSMTILDEVLADLAAEGDDVEHLVADLPPSDWMLPTPSPRWTIAHQIGHLASGDELALLAATDPVAFGGRLGGLVGDFDSFADADAAQAAATPPADLLRRWRAARESLDVRLAGLPPGQKVPWMAGPMAPATMASSRIMEVFAHGQDIADALGVRRVPTARIEHVAHFGVRTRDFSYLARGLTPPEEPFRVELTAPDGRLWAWGPENASQVVRGPAVDFCLLVTRRRHRDDLALTARGAEADQWLGIAQAYVGPVGHGRQPGQFTPPADNPAS